MSIKVMQRAWSYTGTICRAVIVNSLCGPVTAFAVAGRIVGGVH